MELSSIILCIILNVLAFILKPIINYVNRNKKQIVPKIKNDVLELNATQLAAKIRSKALKSEDVMKVYIDRVQEVNPIINAMVQDRFKQALTEAQKIDAFLSETSMSEDELRRKKPLLGVPLTVKECCSVKGMKLSMESLMHLDRVAEDDGEAVAKLKKAGAIPILISNIPEYAFSWHCNNFVTGLTKNPYDTTKSAGGSSGGEGALLGAAASVIGVGSDMGGSIRIPAAFNGVFGHKPSKGLISIKNHNPIQKNKEANEITTVGPLCRYAEDLPLMVRIMSGDNENKYKLQDPVDLSEVDVYFMETSTHPIFQISVQDEIQGAVRRAVQHLRNKCKSRIMSGKFPSLSKAYFMLCPSMMIYDPKNLDTDTGVKDPQSFKLLPELLKILIGKSLHTFQWWYFQFSVLLTKKTYAAREKEFRQMTEDLRVNMLSKLGNNGIFVYPNFPMAAFPHSYFALSSMGLQYTMIFNVLGFPSTAIPMGLDKDGMPIGIQVIAAPNNDRLCLAVAKELSKLHGWIPPN